MTDELEGARSALVQKIGENVTVRRVAKVTLRCATRPFE